MESVREAAGARAEAAALPHLAISFHAREGATVDPDIVARFVAMRAGASEDNS
jgi:hypothetical protein